MTNCALGRVGVRFDETRSLPDLEFGDARGALLGAGEVRYAATGTGKAGDVFRLQEAPDSFPDFLLGHSSRKAAKKREDAKGNTTSAPTSIHGLPRRPAIPLSRKTDDYSEDAAG